MEYEGREVIASFQGKYRWLSNFWSCFVELDGDEYPSVENAYQAAKTLDLELRVPFQKYFPGKAKTMGRSLPIRPDWEEVKLYVMEDLLRQKFVGELAKRLVDTKHDVLVEENTWNDTYWGVCKGVGHNHLGRILMRIRDGL